MDGAASEGAAWSGRKRGITRRDFSAQLWRADVLHLPSQPVLKDLLNRIWLWERCDKKDMTRMSQSARDVKAGIPAAVLLNSLIQLISSRLLLPKSILLSPEGSDPAQVAVDSEPSRYWTSSGDGLHIAVDVWARLRPWCHALLSYICKDKGRCPINWK